MCYHIPESRARGEPAAGTTLQTRDQQTETRHPWGQLQTSQASKASRPKHENNDREFTRSLPLAVPPWSLFRVHLR